jgi:hypothetical protein
MRKCIMVVAGVVWKGNCEALHPSKNNKAIEIIGEEKIVYLSLIRTSS